MGLIQIVLKKLKREGKTFKTVEFAQTFIKCLIQCNLHFVRHCAYVAKWCGVWSVECGV